MKKMLLLILLGLSTTSYAQFYEPEHLLHLCGQWGVHQQFGYDMLGVGDVNNDGYDDFAVSMTFGSPSPEALFSIYYGGSPPDSIPDIIFRNPYPTGNFGYDYNVGDVNGDGFLDIGAAGFFELENLSRVYIYYGGSMLDTVPDIVLTHQGYWDGFGANVVGLGDINEDSFGDIAIFGSNYQNCRGKVWIYFGGNPMDTIPDWEKAGQVENAGFGFSMAGGDLNGDGYSDFAICESAGMSTGYDNISVFFGRTALDTIPDIFLQGNSYSGYNICCGLSIVDDLNGDNFADLLVETEPPYGVIIFYGRSSFQLVQHDVALAGLSSSAWYCSTCRAGDVNADGYGDIIVGQNGNEQAFGGRVLVYLGGRWVSPNPYMVWNGWGQPWEGCGEAVCDPGDINGDGVDDIMFADFNSFNRPGCVEIWEGDSAFVAAVLEEPNAVTPSDFRLLPPYPNPFNSSLNITLEISPINHQDLTLSVYNILGQLVMDLTTELKQSLGHSQSGPINLTWEGKDRTGIALGSGIYFVELNDGLTHQVQKAVLLR